MIYKLGFHASAKKEWASIDKSIQKQFKKKLIERLNNPHVKADSVSGMTHCYKIKLRSSGFRLVYQVIDEQVLVSVVAVGKREKNHAYKMAMKRL